MIRLFLAFALTALALPAQDLMAALKKVEDRYNSSKTLVLDFEQRYSAQGMARRPEQGKLYLRKPGKMRWEYSSPEGKVFLTDGKESFFYSPRTNRVEKGRMKETQDFRTPFAFLLGKLDFEKEFNRFVSRPEGKNLWVKAEPKSDKFPYEAVEFLVTPEYEISELKIYNRDSSILDFHFQDEKRNVQLAESMFQFRPPAGAEVVEVTN